MVVLNSLYYTTEGTLAITTPTLIVVIYDSDVEWLKP